MRAAWAFGEKCAGKSVSFHETLLRGILLKAVHVGDRSNLLCRRNSNPHIRHGIACSTRRVEQPRRSSLRGKPLAGRQASAHLRCVVMAANLEGSRICHMRFGASRVAAGLWRSVPDSAARSGLPVGPAGLRAHRAGPDFRRAVNIAKEKQKAGQCAAGEWRESMRLVRRALVEGIRWSVSGTRPNSRASRRISGRAFALATPVSHAARRIKELITLGEPGLQPPRPGIR